MMLKGAKTPTKGYGLSENPQRRSDGVLTNSEIEKCRSRGQAIAFDPVQIGWVRQDLHDDLAYEAGALSWSMSRRPSRNAHYVFRAWRPQDAPTLARLLSNRSLWTYMPEAYPGRIEPNVALELIALNNGSNHHFVRAVEFRGRVIGQARLAFDDAPKEGEIGYWLDEAAWGQGHGYVIVSRFVADVFRLYPGLDRLVARVHRDNAASARILTRLGFGVRPDGKDREWLNFAHERPTRHGAAW